METKNTSIASINTSTLIPIGMVISIIGFSFAIGMSFQSTNQTKADLESFKAEYRDSQETFRKEYKENQIEIRSDVKGIASQVQDIRVLMLSNPAFSNQAK